MTDRHVSDDLPMLLTGDATRDVVLGAATHLRSCPDCQQELVSAVVAHAALTSAHRFAPEMVAAGQPEEPEPVEAGPLPDLSTLFAQARQDAVTKASQPARRHRRRTLSLVAAAAVVIGGGGTAIGFAVNGSSPDERTVQLDAFGTGKVPGTSGKVTIVDNSKVRVDAAALPKLDSQHFYEVWVVNDERTRMQSVGQLGSNNSAVLPVQSKVLSRYNDFEISRQRTNQAEYSGISVLHGQYG